LERLENTAKMGDLLNDYIVVAKLFFKDFKDGQKLKTINGKELNVVVKSEV